MKTLGRMLLMIVIACWTGCTGPVAESHGPSAGEIESYLKQQVPAALQLQSVTLGTATKDGTTWTVPFEAALVPKETLYAPVDLDVELAKLSWKRGARAMEAPKPILIRAVHLPADVLRTSGKLTAEPANGWQFRDFTWDLDRPSIGQPRDTFVPEALLWRSPEANDPVYLYVHQGLFASLPVRTGATYQDAQLDSFTGDSALLSHARGNCQVKFDELPPVLQDFFHRGGLQAKAAAASRAAVAAQPRSRPTAEIARPSVAPAPRSVEPQPERPPSNADDIIAEHLRQVTTARNTINVKTQSPVFDELVWAWKVECEYSFYATDSRSAGGKRLEGKGYAWFRDKLIVRWRDIVPPRSAFD